MSRRIFYGNDIISRCTAQKNSGEYMELLCPYCGEAVDLDIDEI